MVQMRGWRPFKEANGRDEFIPADVYEPRVDAADRSEFTPWQEVRKEVEQKSIRAQLLDEAKDLITGDRNNHYGPPHEDFTRTADIMSSLGFRFDEMPIKAHHVAMIMATVKLSRMTWSPDKKDNWVDLAGYAACGWEARRLTTDIDEDHQAEAWTGREERLGVQLYQALSPGSDWEKLATDDKEIWITLAIDVREIIQNEEDHTLLRSDGHTEFEYSLGKTHYNSYDRGNGLFKPWHELSGDTRDEWIEGAVETVRELL